MDPIAHTLAGATMAQTGLKKTTPLATATLIIGANLPDIDAVVTVFGSDISLLLRRGWTHGIAALVVLPMVLTGLIVLYDRWIRRRRDPDKTPVKPRAVLALGYLGVASHLFLDWLNTYGIRLLAPFDDTWFYGDLLYIIDPWMWLLLAATVMFAHSGTKLSLGAWLGLGAAASVLVTLAPMVPPAAKVVWWLGIATIAFLRWRGVDRSANRKMATGCIVAVLLYLAAMMAGDRLAERIVVDELADRGVHTVEMSGPVPANPFAREIIAASDTHYFGADVRLLGEPKFALRYEPVPIEEPDELTRRVLEAGPVRGFANWMRFPAYEVRQTDDGTRVYVRDLRYVEPDAEDARFGMVTVDVDDDF